MIVIPVLARKPHSARVAADRRARVGNVDPLDQELAERHLEPLDDLRSLVHAPEDPAELPGLVVVELDHGRRLVVAIPAEVVELVDRRCGG